MAFDIQLCPTHDLTAWDGVVMLLSMMFAPFACILRVFFLIGRVLLLPESYHCIFAVVVRLLPGALVAAGPPCSLFVAACQSIHRRSMCNPWGNTANQKVRLANRIWKNFCVVLKVVGRLSLSVLLSALDH